MAPTSVEYDTLTQALHIAEQAARETGDFLFKEQGHERVLRKKAHRDGLLDADLAAEKIILAKLRAFSPSYGILSEETPQEKKDSAYQWIVDPLDGSFNFHHGNPTYGVSIGLCIDNAVAVAVVYLPYYREMFTAMRGCGAWLKGQPIHVSSVTDLDDASVHVGDFTKDGNAQENSIRAKDIAHLADRVGRVRMIGTAATDLAYVACGRAEALVVRNALPWDIDVGRLLITEAGGTVEFYSHPRGKEVAICSNTHIHQTLQDIILNENYDT